VLISGRAKIYERETLADVFLCKGMYDRGSAGTHSPVANPQARPQAGQVELRARAVDVEHASVA